MNKITWNEYYMLIAKAASLRSSDPNTKVGACIVKNNRIISTGYNGFPSGISNEEYPWTKDEMAPDYEKKFFYVVHAELNAILSAKTNLEDAVLYVTKFPCNECAKAIIQAGIKAIIYDDDEEFNEKKNEPKYQAVFRMFKDTGIDLMRYPKFGKKIEIIL